MANYKTLSIIVPVFNEEDYIGACLDAIAAQSESFDEVIVVDNNSSDQTVEIASKYPFVKLLHEDRQGVVYARDTGFDAAKSDLIARIDADTILPDCWAANVRELMADDTIFAATGPVSYYDMPASDKNYKLDHLVRNNLYRGAPHMPFLFGSNMVLRSDSWASLRNQVCRSQELHEDLDLAIHFAKAHKPIAYEISMLASTSSRRYDDDVRSFAHYLSVFRKTYMLHDMVMLAPLFATTIYWFGYFTLYPLRRAYDPQTRSRSWRNLFRKTNARPHPM